MAPLLALLPILTLVLLLAGLRRSAAEAGGAAALVALGAAVIGMDYGAGEGARAFYGPAAEAGYTAMSILWIIFAALSIHEYQIRTGAVATFASWLSSFSGDRRVTALVVAWFFALFLEGAAGFGTPVALAAPLLVGLGFTPAKALVMVLLGHAAGVSFGAAGIPAIALLAAGPDRPVEIVGGIALLHAALGWTMAWAVARIGERGGAVRPPLLAAACFLVPFVLLAWTAGPELPTLGGAIVGAVGFVALQGRKVGGGRPSARPLLGAAAPYLVVIALILLTRLAPPVREALQNLSLDWTLDGGFSGSLAPLYHPGTMLLAGLTVAALANPAGRVRLLPASAAAARRLSRVVIALIAVLLLARLMVHSGMIAALAAWVAAMLGDAWPLASPAVGALGSFVTGSATASNILFADFQQAAAAASGSSNLLAAIGQGAGAGIGNMIAPHNIVAGAATVGLTGGEGKILRRTLPVCLAYAAAAGLVLWMVASWP